MQLRDIRSLRDIQDLLRRSEGGKKNIILGSVAGILFLAALVVLVTNLGANEPVEPPDESVAAVIERLQAAEIGTTDADDDDDYEYDDEDDRAIIENFEPGAGRKAVGPE